MPIIHFLQYQILNSFFHIIYILHLIGDHYLQLTKLYNLFFSKLFILIKFSLIYEYYLPFLNNYYIFLIIIIVKFLNFIKS